ncbi:unnamed protein product [Schistosoma margrebowiei]|uniref:Uncharacterized protein n=1 Tax=Schistosoma margrebowiei TaxID=48269 RepID=A0A183M449_9TREM|nr:unnamed protein product [Schistosoma margrebowiei]
MQLDDSHFADYPALLYHTHQQTQIKTTTVSAASEAVGLNIHNGKIKILKYNTENTNTNTLDGLILETFTYPDSITNERRRSDANVKARIDKPRETFLQLKDMSHSSQLSTIIKVTIFNTNVKTVLLCGTESSGTTTTIIKKVQVFINHRLP